MLRNLLLAGMALASLAMAPLPPKDASQLVDDLRILSADDMQGRFVGTEGSAKARTYIEGRLKTIGVEPMYSTGYEQGFDFTRTKPHHGTNIVGRIVGRDPDGPVMVVSAHYDHLGVQDGQIFNGADDNASGVAGVLAVAEAFAARRPEHTILIVLFDAEEGGLQGSKAFVANPPLPLERVALNLNLDMIGTNHKNELYASGAFPFPWMKARLEALAADAPVKLLLGHDDPKLGKDDWSNQSDHWAFGLAGRPWIYFGVEDHPEYHQPTDDFDTVPLDFFKAAAATVVAAARAFDKDLDAIARREG